MYPKGVTTTDVGDYCIFSAKVVKHLKGERPLLHPIFKTFTLKGNCGVIQEGEEYVAFYDDKETNDFGTSYKVITVTKGIDRHNKADVKNYLDVICGEKIADELMKAAKEMSKDIFDDVSPLDWLETRNSEKLLSIKGIKESKLEQIYKKIEQYESYDVALAELTKFDLSPLLIQNICLAYGSPSAAVDLCKSNPYEMVKKVKGISFKKADEIAKKCGLDMNSPDRLEGLIYNILDENGANGKSFLTINQLINQISEIVPDKNLIDTLNEVVERMVNNNDVMLTNNNTQISLMRYFDLEKNICIEIKRLLDAETDITPPNNWKDIVKELEKEQGWEHTSEQWNGIESALNNNVVVITGKAGTGKSTVVNAIAKILEDYEIDMTCLSAKAAKRISEVTDKPAKTIHRLLGIGFDGQQFRDTKLYSDIIVLDEASMVNGTLFYELLCSINNGKKIIILGDDGQLQPIGECSVFSDMLKSDKLSITKLTEIHRQAQKSAIITKSIRIREQKQIYPKGFLGKTTLGELQDLELCVYEENDTLLEEVLESFDKEFIKNNRNILETQIITPLKKRGNLSTHNINKAIQSKYVNCFGDSFTDDKRDLTIYVGDKVINTVNNYKIKTVNGKEHPIFNGHIGIVKAIENNKLIITFDDVDVVFSKAQAKNLNLAYAITVHSSQGSQWNSVIVAIDNSSWIMLTTEMLYTAITRASKHCILVGQDSAIKQAIRTVEQNTKQTFLSTFLNINI